MLELGGSLSVFPTLPHPPVLPSHLFGSNKNSLTTSLSQRVASGSWGPGSRACRQASGHTHTRALAARCTHFSEQPHPTVQTAHPSPEAHPHNLPSLPASAAWQPPLLLALWEPQEGIHGSCRSGGPAGPGKPSGSPACGSSGVHPRSGRAPAHGWQPGMQQVPQPGPASHPWGQGRLVLLATMAGSRIPSRGCGAPINHNTGTWQS